MADLVANYKDDQLDTSVNEKRRYRKTDYEDGTFSLEDATSYKQKGSTFGAADMNKIILGINELISQLGGWSLKVVNELPPESERVEKTIYLSKN